MDQIAKLQAENRDLKLQLDLLKELMRKWTPRWCAFAARILSLENLENFEQLCGHTLQTCGSWG
jgi:hypothetical protein